MFECKSVGKRDSGPNSSAVKRDSRRFGQLVSSLVGARWSPQQAPGYVKQDRTDGRTSMGILTIGHRPDNKFSPLLMYNPVPEYETPHLPPKLNTLIAVIITYGKYLILGVWGGGLILGGGDYS